jgi:hypothetical protein
VRVKYRFVNDLDRDRGGVSWTEILQRWPPRLAVEGSESAEGNGGGLGMLFANPEEATPGSRLPDITADFDVKRRILRCPG